MARTEEQEIIIDRMMKIKNSLGVRAFAGTGKSFLLKEATEEYKNSNFLGLAFNNSIATENSHKFSEKNSSWFTVHGLARAFFKQAGLKLGTISSGFRPLEILEILDMKEDNNYLLGTAIYDIYTVFCNSSLKEINAENIRKASITQKKHSIITLNDEVLEFACTKAGELWNKQLKRQIPFTHDFYLKLFELKGMAKKITKFDFILIDEAQDSNPVLMSILNQITAKKIYVGDPHQSIYGFRGTLNAMKFAEEQHYLSSTFRYSQEIANEASATLRQYKDEKKAITSKALNPKADKSEAILFRNNSAVIETIDEFINDNISYKTIKDPKEFFTLSMALLDIKEKKPLDPKSNLDFLKKFKNIDAVEAYIKESGDRELKSGFGMMKRYGRGLYRLKIDAQNKFKENNPKAIVLSTGHMSKGLEWGTVRVKSDFPDIQKLWHNAKIVNASELLDRDDENDLSAHEIVQEVNLLYVAKTRAKHKLILDRTDEIIE